MGKIRKIKTHTPAGVGLDASLLNGQDIDSEEEGCGPIEAISVHLQRPDVEEKLNGLHSFAVLALRREKVQEICQSNLVRIAAPMLCDKDMAIRDAAAGALRNLSVFGSEVCDFLVDNDILTALLSLVAGYDLTKPVCFESELHADIFLQATHLLRNLCESSPTATEAFNQSNFLRNLLLCLDYQKFGLEISISVAQLVLVVSENNSSSWNLLANATILTELLKVTEGSHSLLYLSALAAGILCNVPACSSAYTREILGSLDKLLTIDTQAQLMGCKNEIKDLKSKNEAPVLEISMETEEMSEAQTQNQPKPQSEADSAVKNLEYLLDAQRLVAEIITNLGSSDDQSGWGSDSDQSETESVVDFDMNEQSADNDAGALPVNFVETILQNNVVQKLWQKSQPLDTALEKLLSQQESIREKVSKMRVSYLICLQNLCNVLSVHDLGGHNDIYNMWFHLGQQAFKGTEEATIMEAITSLMRSALTLLKTRKDLFSQITENDLNMIIESAQKSTIMDIRVNWNRMLGTLGCLLSEALVKGIVQFLLNSCAQEEDLWAMSEGLDALMDIFADDDWPQIIADLNMCERVQTLEEQFKSKFRQQRRDLKERRPTIYTVKSNFSRFVFYLNKNCKQ
ncbi:HEAT repeat-containing protein 3 [Drosophila pseudoobscura]|uniref:HEAT repeat-containing protein 3 n=1 Tax=Drosophila pseudoobscura pseudoobscura TaxID=46245 RepID=A0A6I8UQC6_DROPS|nr:HEAT repeat-containing protein 3 [Drosophila pseudoobscura]